MKLTKREWTACFGLGGVIAIVAFATCLFGFGDSRPYPTVEPLHKVRPAPVPHTTVRKMLYVPPRQTRNGATRAAEYVVEVEFRDGGYSLVVSQEEYDRCWPTGPLFLIPDATD